MEKMLGRVEAKVAKAEARARAAEGVLGGAKDYVLVAREEARATEVRAFQVATKASRPSS